MHSIQLTKLTQIVAQCASIPIHPEAAKALEDHRNQSYGGNVNQFMRDLAGYGQQAGITFLENQILPEQLPELLANLTFPVIVFSKHAGQTIEPLVICLDAKQKLQGTLVSEEGTTRQMDLNTFPPLVTYENAADTQKNGQIILVTSFPMTYLTEGNPARPDENQPPPTPLQRFFRLLRAEKKDILYIYIYAIIVGLISLILPLGIQAIISTISGGLFFSSVIVLIIVITAAVMASGGLLIMQITLVEVLQQRIFARAAFEFAFRLPNIKLDALRQYYPPELMNRFFDVVTIQKTLPKILVELSGAVLQILFGLVLLSFYHPFFLAFALVLLGIVFLIFRVTGSKGLQTSLTESKYKYRIAYWLQEIARTVHSFRLAGNGNLHLQKMDEYVNSYLYYRKSHFGILRLQLVYIILFKTLIIGGLLVLGTVLVVDRQITLGQFVASEVIIVLVVGAVEKIIINMDSVYDLLTGLEKVGSVTDLPLDKKRGMKTGMDQFPNGLRIRAKELSYRYPEHAQDALQQISFTAEPGEHIGLTGASGAGSLTIARILAGITREFEGSLTVNQASMRDVHPDSLRMVVETNLFSDEVFNGTVLENITMNRTHVQEQDIWWAIEKAGLRAFVDTLPNGLYTLLEMNGSKPANRILRKIVLARCLAARPKLLILKDNFYDLPTDERQELLTFLMQPDNPWTLLVISNYADLLVHCDRILLLDESRIVAQGSYEELSANEFFRTMVNRERISHQL